jgi:inositol 1,4,5-triphosphate receptor type 1
MCLHEVQVYLDREGTSDLVAELVMKSSLSPNVFMEAVQLGIALLECGNPVIQRSLYTKLQSAETSAIFFKVFHDKVRESQAEIRSTMSVNTTEMASTGNNKLQDHFP